MSERTRTTNLNGMRNINSISRTRRFLCGLDVLKERIGKCPQSEIIAGKVQNLIFWGNF